MIIQKRFVFKKTPLDIPLILFLASQFLSFLFSIDRHTSIFGYYSRFNGGLLSLGAYSLLYWAFVSNCEAKDVLKVLKTSLVSALIVSIYGILEHFGHSFSCLMFTGNFDVACWVQDVKNRVFASLGQPNWLATYLTTLLPASLALNYELRIMNYDKIKTIIRYSVFCILFLCLIFTGSRSGFLGFIASLAVFGTAILYTNRNNLKSLFHPLVRCSLIVVLLLIIFGSPFDQLNRLLHYKSWLAKISPPPAQTQQETSDQTAAFISESGDIRKIVWKGAIGIFKHYPVFGSGVETFAYSYYNFRPMEHNLVSEWDFLYNKAHNEYLNYLSTTGLVGLGAYLLFIGAFVIWSVKRILKEPGTAEKAHYSLFIIHSSLLAGWLSILISNFFGFSVVVVSLYFYLIPALALVLGKNQETEKNPSANHNEIWLAIPLFIVLCSLFKIVNLWRADYYYAQGLKLSKLGEYTLSHQSLSKAVQLFPSEPVFLNDLSLATANLSLLAASQKEATLAAQLLQSSVSYSDKALQISPYNLNIYKTRVKVFYTLSSLDPQYLLKAIETIQTAMKLAPTDPKLVYNLGLLYGRMERVEDALAAIQKAIEMKPNYEEARNALATFYEDLGMKKEAAEQLEYILQTKKNDPSILQRIEKLK